MAAQTLLRPCSQNSSFAPALPYPDSRVHPKTVGISSPYGRSQRASSRAARIVAIDRSQSISSISVVEMIVPRQSRESNCGRASRSPEKIEVRRAVSVRMSYQNVCRRWGYDDSLHRGHRHIRRCVTLSNACNRASLNPDFRQVADRGSSVKVLFETRPLVHLLGLRIADFQCTLL